MGDNAVFAQRLREMTSYLLCAAEQVPNERRYWRPPFRNAERTAAREISHLALYECAVALPSM